ncbi:putative nuclease HARBI1 [Gigantopelta aegis]|uniref:putative nuclease HARBI1 n=1 Tax=Gigantopelta aegis TaxID=1735272 RepID=UPI001B88B8FF|nr:putative nuclease HARBI1 [Gigantopelta aegis]
MKLAITLRHLATEIPIATLQYEFRVARNTICLLVKEVCDALVMELKNEVIVCPVDRGTWEEVAEEFLMRWNVPHAYGALDGKRVAIRKPPKTGTMYYNYKGFFSVVLMAVVDADYKFMWIDVGGFGSQSDAQIYNQSELKECLEDGSIGLPPPSLLPNDIQDFPYFLLGDDAFGLRTYLMKSYSGRQLTREEMIANYRISRARRVVENAFGIMAQRWRVLLSTMQQMPVTVQTIVEACVCLHNFIRLRNPSHSEHSSGC